jgi:hypothetical protein
MNKVIDLSDLTPQPPAKVLTQKQIADSDPWRAPNRFDVPLINELTQSQKGKHNGQ